MIITQTRNPPPRNIILVLQTKINHIMLKTPLPINGMISLIQASSCGRYKRDACPSSPTYSRDEEEEKKKSDEHEKKFKDMRKKHYNEAEMMRKWMEEHANDDEDEEEDDEEEEDGAKMK